ncbi:MAG: TRAP transporter substrate-binding protein DctP [Defluviicoccus sp.]|nr:TRAP transporter substrate-binding protein DctP [Defluviicoccus sp.]
MKTGFALTALAAATAVAAGAGTAAAMTDKLNAVTSLDQNNALVRSFKANYLNPLNEKLKGKVEIKYLGGQEIVPPRKAVTALRRGQFNVLHSPTAYYIGTVPEGYAILAANQGPKALRANGAWEILQEIYLKKAGAHLLAWGENMTSYNTYLMKQPKFDEHGVPDLTGLKMRATGTYRPLFRALGATTINIKSSEVFTALQRGTVDGFGFTDISIVPLGVHKVIKYRIQPNYYQTNTVVTVHADTWNKLAREKQDAMTGLAKEYETTSVHWIEKERKAEDKQVMAAGVKDIVLKGDAAARYLDIAHREIWKQLKERSEYHDKLLPLMYIPGKPNRQADLGRALRQ